MSKATHLELIPDSNTVLKGKLQFIAELLSSAGANYLDDLDYEQVEDFHSICDEVDRLLGSL